MVREYTEAEKGEAFARYLELGNAKAVALELGYPIRTVQNWAKVHNWDGNIEVAERQIGKFIADYIEEDSTVEEEAQAQTQKERKAQLVTQAQDALGTMLGRAEAVKVRYGDKAARAALDLAKTMMILEGKTASGQEGQPITLQTLVIFATGAGEEGSLQDQGRSLVVSTRGTEVESLGEAG